ncbi:MAG: synthetase, synthase [Candidatus Parcubacteria bacterium]|jgi:CTP synthase
MKKKNHKYIFVIGGVMSGVGKGVATASIGTILESMNYKVNLMKVDPYLNVDAGTMNPTEHGEVFVLNSGLETDQDMGNYERFSNKDADDFSYMTSGMVYRDVIEKERNLVYGGRCVEAIPDIRDEIISRFKKSAVNSKADISIVEIGGTIGDFQNALFYEAARVMKFHNPEDVIFVMVSYLPIPGTLGEMKTKPTQNAIRQLSSFGIQADFIIARSSIPMDEKRKEKLALTCGLKKGAVISAPDIESIYDVPLNFEKDKIGEMVVKALGLPVRIPDLSKWKNFVQKTKNTKDEVHIAVVGKYFDTGDFVLSDSYLSVIEAIKFSAYHLNKKAKISWLNSKEFEKDPKKVKDLSKYDGILVPGGFGGTGIEGKINVIKYCRENKIPYFGICYGMQLMVVEYARNVAKLKDAHTTEINPKTKYPVIDVMLEQKEKLAKNQYGGTMRLGSYDCVLEEGTVAYTAYTKTKYWNIQKGNSISERHRHRYEVNPEFVEQLSDAGLVFSGTSPNKKLMEIAELPKSEHPFFLGAQFHPEFKGRPISPHPLFTEFVKAAIGNKKD